MMVIGNKIRTLRKERGLTLAQLATMVDIHISYLSMIETGRVTAPSDRLIKRLATALETTYEELMSENGVSLADMVTAKLSTTPMTNEQARKILRILDDK